MTVTRYWYVSLPLNICGEFSKLSRCFLLSLQIKLWYADARYDLALGNLISIWTMHVSAFKGVGHPTAPRKKSNTSADVCRVMGGGHTPALMTSIFPEGESGSHIMIHQRSDIGIACRMPLGYREGQTFSSLDPLNEVYRKAAAGENTKVLVFVKGINGVKQRGFPFNLLYPWPHEVK